MTVKEFSDSFDTLLNSYASKAIFGDQAGDTEIVLDEYEKSVLLTQAQDNVIKSYFEKHTNQLGQGFDDSSRRQVDFSSLIKVASLTAVDSDKMFDKRGIIYKLPTVEAEDGAEYSRVLYILNEALVGYTGSDTANFVVGTGSLQGANRQTIKIKNVTDDPLQVSIYGATNTSTCTASYTASDGNSYASLTVTVFPGVTAETVHDTIAEALNPAQGEPTAHADIATTEGALVVNGVPNYNEVRSLNSTLLPANFRDDVDNEVRYVIIPINYKEYDREMSKAYANPLKKQAWRLFQNISAGYDIYSELIPIWNVARSNVEDDLHYKIRYVERPTPIVLVDLPPGLSIDGYRNQQKCILNPIIHPEILQEAVRLAIESRASAVARAQAYQEAARRQPNT